MGLKQFWHSIRGLLVSLKDGSLLRIGLLYNDHSNFRQVVARFREDEKLRRGIAVCMDPSIIVDMDRLFRKIEYGADWPELIQRVMDVREDADLRDALTFIRSKQLTGSLAMAAARSQAELAPILEQLASDEKTVEINLALAADESQNRARVARLVETYLEDEEVSHMLDLVIDNDMRLGSQSEIEVLGDSYVDVISSLILSLSDELPTLAKQSSKREFNRLLQLVSRVPEERAGVISLYLRNVAAHAALVKDYSPSSFPQIHFSQEGEDILIKKLLGYRHVGTYVDIGAHHPSRLSNTRMFQRLGWHGMNIDPTPESIELFRKERPDDINLNVGIAREPGSLVLYEYDEPAFNTFSEQKVSELQRERGIEPVSRKTVDVVPFSSIQTEYRTFFEQPVSLLNIDVEGFENEVLASIDFTNFKPLLICIEFRIDSLLTVADAKAHEMLASEGYVPHSRLDNSLIYRHIETPTGSAVE